MPNNHRRCRPDNVETGTAGPAVRLHVGLEASVQAASSSGRLKLIFRCPRNRPPAHAALHLIGCLARAEPLGHVDLSGRGRKHHGDTGDTRVGTAPREIACPHPVGIAAIATAGTKAVPATVMHHRPATTVGTHAYTFAPPSSAMGYSSPSSLHSRKPKPPPASRKMRRIIDSQARQQQPCTGNPNRHEMISTPRTAVFRRPSDALLHIRAALPPSPQEQYRRHPQPTPATTLHSRPPPKDSRHPADRFLFHVANNQRQIQDIALKCAQTLEEPSLVVGIEMKLWISQHSRHLSRNSGRNTVGRVSTRFWSSDSINSASVTV